MKGEEQLKKKKKIDFQMQYWRKNRRRKVDRRTKELFEGKHGVIRGTPTKITNYITTYYIQN